MQKTRRLFSGRNNVARSVIMRKTGNHECTKITAAYKSESNGIICKISFGLSEFAILELVDDIEEIFKQI